MSRNKKRWLWFFALIFSLLILLALPEILHRNQGESNSIGSVGNGRLENAWLLPYSGKNFRCFSPLSYYLFNNAYTHSRVYRTVLEAYKSCEKTCPGIQFRYMECSDKHGGKLLIHRTHQNGLSVDFMSPKRKGSRQSIFFDRLGLWHYLLEFTNSGRLKINSKIQIDFESIGKHILAIDDAARRNGLRIKKVIFMIELKDQMRQTESWQEMQRRKIYFVQRLSNFINRIHDDHYHIDFEKVE